MATVTKIVPVKRKSRFKVIFDFDWNIVISRETLLTFQLKEGYHLSPEEIKYIQEFDQNAQLKEQAFRYLKQRAHSSTELKQKLVRKGFSEDKVLKFIDKLKQEGYLNDEEFLQMFIHDRVQFTKKGSFLIIQELKQKGYREEDIIPVLRKYLTQEDELKRARELAKKKWEFYRKKTVNERKQKVFQFLIQKGYTIDIVKKALELYINEEELYGDSE